VTHHALWAVVGLAFLAGCGPPAGSDYAAAVCTDVGRWVRSVNTSLDQLRVGAEDRTSVGEERRAFLDHLDDVESATAAVTRDLREAGAPDVTGGRRFADTLVVLADRVGQAVDEVRAQVDDLPGTLRRFRSEAGALLGGRLGGAIRELLGSLAPSSAGELGEVFREEPACRGVLPDEAPGGPGGENPPA
jgi:hypothetical protein